MVMYISIDKDNYVDSWCLNPQDNLIKVPKPPEDFKTDFSFYRLENNKLIFDDTKAVSVEKSIIKNRVTNYHNNDNKIEIIINKNKYYFTNNSENKSFLQKSYYLISDDMIEETFFNLENEYGEMEVISIGKSNINELWLLSFIKDEEINKKIKEDYSIIKKLKTMDDVINFKNNFNGGILND